MARFVLAFALLALVSANVVDEEWGCQVSCCLGTAYNSAGTCTRDEGASEDVKKNFKVKVRHTKVAPGTSAAARLGQGHRCYKDPAHPSGRNCRCQCVWDNNHTFSVHNKRFTNHIGVFPSNVAAGVNADGSRGLYPATWHPGWIKYNKNTYPGSSLDNGVINLQPESGSATYMALAFRDLIGRELTVGQQYTITTSVMNTGGTSCTFVENVQGDGACGTGGNFDPMTWCKTQSVSSGASADITYTFTAASVAVPNSIIGGTESFVVVGTQSCSLGSLEVDSLTIVES